MCVWPAPNEGVGHFAQNVKWIVEISDDLCDGPGEQKEREPVADGRCGGGEEDAADDHHTREHLDQRRQHVRRHQAKRRVQDLKQHIIY